MKRTFRKRAGMLAIGAVAAASAMIGGCTVDATPYLVIKAVRGLELSGEGCAPSETLQPQTQYDAGVGRDKDVSGLGLGKFLIGFELVNALSPNGDDDMGETTTGRLDSNRIQLTELKITIDNKEPWDFLPKDNTATLTHLIGPGEPLGLVAAVFDEKLATAMILGAEGKQSPIDQANESFPLNISLQIFGRTLDGTEVESNIIEMTITICNRCLDLKKGSECIDTCATDDCSLEDFAPTAGGCSYAQLDGYLCGGG